jgi:hypothetical protein
MVLLEALVARPRSGEYATRLVGFPQPHLTLPAGMSVRPLFTGVATERSGDRLRRIVRWGLRVGAQVLATAAPLGAGPSLPLSSRCDATGRTAGTLFSLRPRERLHQTLSAILLPHQVILGQWNGVAQGSRACENAEEVPRRLDWGEGQRGIGELVGRLIVNGKFVVRVWPPADMAHRLAAEGCGRCLTPHRGQGRCGGKTA